MTQEKHPYSDTVEKVLNPNNTQGSSVGVFINFKRILGKAMLYWYLIILSLVVSLVVAYLINRYSTPVYSVTASIIVRESNENAAAEFLYKSNPLINPYRNFYNELYIMKSYPLIQRVVERLKFNIMWYREGNIKTSEVFYPNFPITVELDDYAAVSKFDFNFVILDSNRFSLEYFDNGKDDGPIKVVSYFNEPIHLNETEIVFRRTSEIPESWFGRNYLLKIELPTEVAKKYSNKLTATWAELGASVINLEVKGALYEKEILFLSEYIKQYQQYDLEKKNQTATMAIEFLDKQLEFIGDSLNYFDRQIEDFKQKHLYADLTTESERLLNQLQDLETKRTQILLQSNYLNYLQNYLNDKNGNYEQVVPPSAMGITDNVLTELINRLTELQFGLRMLGGFQSEKNPLVRERLARIDELKKDILEGVRSMHASLAINQDFINKQISELERELAGLPVTERELLNIKRKYSIRENLYLFLMQKRAEAGISRASTTSDIVVVNPPAVRSGPISPKPVRNYALAFAAGLILPFFFFFLSELLNYKVQSREDVEKLTRIPVIGGIGHSSFGNDNLVVLKNPKSLLAESFRALRSNLSYFTRDKEKCVVVITSSISGEGKTFTTINLATVLAFAGKKVLVIGADMRKPSIFADFDLKNEVGLSTYLAGLTPGPLDVVQHSGIDNLDVMSSGPVPPNPSELLLLPKVEEMLNVLQQTYEYILFDTPPLALVSDAYNLISLADHTIFMVRQNYTPLYYLQNLQDFYVRRNLTNISILLNDIRRTGPGYGFYYGYLYGYGYGYGYGYRFGKTPGNRAGDEAYFS